MPTLKNIVLFKHCNYILLIKHNDYRKQTKVFVIFVCCLVSIVYSYDKSEKILKILKPLFMHNYNIQNDIGGSRDEFINLLWLNSLSCIREYYTQCILIIIFDSKQWCAFLTDKKLRDVCLSIVIISSVYKHHRYFSYIQ